jgi:hypothetical protein
MIRCNSCGTVGSECDQFCGGCGSRMAPTAPASRYYPPPWAPPKDDTGPIMAIVIIVVLGGVILPAMVYVIGFGVSTHLPQSPSSIGATISPSTNATKWVVTFTSVPTGLAQNGTTISLTTSGGSTLLRATTMSNLEGAGVDGVTYVPAVTGPSYTLCAPGDRILIPIGNGPGQYPIGTQVEIINGPNVLFSGTLQ